MYPRITNASDINKPIIGVLDESQIDKVTKMLDEYDYQLTPKKRIKRAILISFILFVIVWAFYNVFCVLEYSEVSAESLSVGNVEIASDDALTVELKSNDYDISKNDYVISTQGEVDDILYITVTEPIIPLKSLRNRKKVELTYGKYDINIEGISAVYYMGKDAKDIFLIWKR